MSTFLWVVFGVSVAALIHSQILYPLLMALASRRGVTARAVTEWPSVSLIIPAHNEAVVIDAKLQNSLAIDYPADRLDIIVASDGSEDGTVEIARDYEKHGVKVLDLRPRRGKASVLNDAVDAVSGEVLCLCDANVMFRPDAIRRLVAHLSDPSIGAVTGDVRLASEQSDFGEGESLYYRIERAVQSGESRFGSLTCVDGGMYVLKRELFRKLKPDTILDDFTTTINVVRAGKRVVYEPEAIADENGTPSWKQEYRRRIRTTRGAIQSLRRGYFPAISQPVVLFQYVSHKLIRWFGPFWLIGVLLSSILLWDQGGVWIQAIVVAQGVCYLLAIAAALSRSLRESAWAGIPFYFAISHLAMLVGITRSLYEIDHGAWERTERQLPVGSTLAGTATVPPADSE